ncbi:MAG: septal ring lytic transglycosylase RlpA family protein, partial [Campylobacterota bacterium]|nr:septal ring lytic transglycosylase RlpA family protein [Campylobacterota bacterium]
MNKFIYLTLLFLIFLTGCSTKYDYTNKSYHSSSYAEAQNRQINTQNSKIRNSPAVHRATMRPYTVFGKKYYPTETYISEQFKGIASWYGPKFNNKKTSNGEIYNMYAMTAASKTLPMNTMVKVYSKDSKKSVIVRINDRGPFVAGRIIDLSNVAAHRIDMVKKGTAEVILTVIGFNGKIATSKEEKNEIQNIRDYYLQIGVFSKEDGANSIKNKLEMIL